MTCYDVTYRTVWERPQAVTLGRPQVFIFQRPKDVGTSLGVTRRHPLVLHRGPYGDVHRTSLGGNFAEWDDGFKKW